jgi:hypothetical protein
LSTHPEKDFIMEEEAQLPSQHLTFACPTIAVAHRGNQLDQVSLFPVFPAPQDVFPDLKAAGGEKFPSPQFLIYTSNERGHMYVSDNFGAKVLGKRVTNLDKEITLNIFDVTVLVKVGYPDQVIMYTDLPYPTRTVDAKKKAPVVFLVDEGFGTLYCQEVLKLDCKIQALDDMTRKG